MKIKLLVVAFLFLFSRNVKPATLDYNGITKDSFEVYKNANVTLSINRHRMQFRFINEFDSYSFISYGDIIINSEGFAILQFNKKEIPFSKQWVSEIINNNNFPIFIEIYDTIIIENNFVSLNDYLIGRPLKLINFAQDAEDSLLNTNGFFINPEMDELNAVSIPVILTKESDLDYPIFTFMDGIITNIYEHDGLKDIKVYHGSTFSSILNLKNVNKKLWDFIKSTESLGEVTDSTKYLIYGIGIEKLK